MLPTDPEVIKFLVLQHTLRRMQTTHRLMHLAGSFGKPGSLTEGGQRYRETSWRLDLLNATALLYALQKGYIAIDAYNLVNPFDSSDKLDWNFDS